MKIKLTTYVLCAWNFNTKVKSSLSGRAIKRGGGVKPSEPLRKKHFIFYDLKESHEAQKY